AGTRTSRLPTCSSCSSVISSAHATHGTSRQRSDAQIAPGPVPGPILRGAWRRGAAGRSGIRRRVARATGVASPAATPEPALHGLAGRGAAVSSGAQRSAAGAAHALGRQSCVLDRYPPARAVGAAVFPGQGGGSPVAAGRLAGAVRGHFVHPSRCGGWIAARPADSRAPWRWLSAAGVSRGHQQRWATGAAFPRPVAGRGDRGGRTAAASGAALYA